MFFRMSTTKSWTNLVILFIGVSSCFPVCSCAYQDIWLYAQPGFNGYYPIESNTVTGLTLPGTRQIYRKIEPVLIIARNSDQEEEWQKEKYSVPRLRAQYVQPLPFPPIMQDPFTAGYYYSNNEVLPVHQNMLTVGAPENMILTRVHNVGIDYGFGGQLTDIKRHRRQISSVKAFSCGSGMRRHRITKKCIKSRAIVFRGGTH